ncbi:hypothetical protein M0Q28_01530 [Patescibacteria group bacterium]|jgi:hypothetical protein|nr:hypothetical protein [Patescibacteria group bacterium]
MKKIVLGIFAVILLVLIGAFGWYAWRIAYPATVTPPPMGTPPSEEEVAVRGVVENLGKALKNVPLSGSRDVATQAMDEQYRGYVSAALLQRWKSDPVNALGRLTSSPWPERIDILRVERRAATRYVVFGEVVLMTSVELTEGGDAGRLKTELQVDNIGGDSWVVSEVSVENPQVVEPWSVFSRPGDFSLRYPANFELTEGEGFGGANLDESIVRIGIPDGIYTTIGTNYSEAYLVVSRSTKPEVVHTCLDFDPAYPVSKGPDVRSNGITFRFATTTEAAAGNIYESALYRTTYQSRCYEIALVIHTGNAGNYDPPVAEFDRSLAMEPLEEIFRTFAFPLTY